MKDEGKDRMDLRLRTKQFALRVIRFAILTTIVKKVKSHVK
jgi:hypothetical protein